MKKILQPIFNSDTPILGRLEFLVATAAFLVVVFFVPDEIRSHGSGQLSMNEVLTSGEYYRHLFMFFSLYAGAVLLNFFAVPSFIAAQPGRGLIFSGIAIALLVVAFFRFDIVLPALGMFIAYTIIRYTGIYLWRNAAAIHAKYRFISPAVIVASCVWLLIFPPFVFSGDQELAAFWAVVIPAAIFFYTYSFHALAPATINKRYPFLAFLLRVALLLFALGFVIALGTVAITGNEEAPVIFAFANFFFHLAFTSPLIWLLFKKSSAGREMLSLKKELGQSVASFDFLRSQINPHFLFNALNTLYGMAIIENASRTSEGIQRLGDMMRFMLHENVQEKIPLSREVEYLRNYIALQRLRTDNNHTIRVETSIDEEVYLGSISPMLLIPFVENAFKHGISFRDPSLIRITMEVKDSVLYFDVHNNKHNRQGTDPERENSGIGLKNVRQRLELLYPGQHELIIRETISEFFVHLTLRLSLQHS
jgi:two-component system LytT family sensor kinase